MIRLAISVFVLKAIGISDKGDEEIGVNVLLQQQDEVFFRAKAAVMAKPEPGARLDVAETLLHVFVLHAPLFAAVQEGQLVLFLAVLHVQEQVFAESLVNLHRGAVGGTITQLLFYRTMPSGNDGVK